MASDDIDDFLERVTHAQQTIQKLSSGELTPEEFDQTHASQRESDARQLSEKHALADRQTQRGRAGKGAATDYEVCSKVDFYFPSLSVEKILVSFQCL